MASMRNIKKQQIYRDLARYYDLIYSWKDYEKEAKRIKRLIAIYKRSEGNELLETACGTGKHILYLKKDFNILATDVNPGILRVARKNVRGVRFRKADMATLNMRKTFDVIICLFSSIGYVKTYANLKRTIENFSLHLKQGGVVIIEPWFTKSTYKTGMIHMTVYEDDAVKIARQNVSRSRGNISVLDMHYLVAEQGKGIKHIVDRHELGMFETKKFLSCMRRSGLRSRFLKNGLMKDRGVYIGVKA